MPKLQHDDPNQHGSVNSSDVSGRIISPQSTLDHLRAVERIAGPDDPIYRSGPVFTCVRMLPIPDLTTAEQKAIVERMRLDPKYVQA